MNRDGAGARRRPVWRLEDAAGVEDPLRVEGRLDRAHDADDVGPTCSTSASRRAMPIPCSAVTVPPSAIAALYRSARARSVSSSARGSSWSKMKFGWRLPSPAWPNVAIRMSYFSPIARIARRRSGTRLRGTPTSSIRTWPRRSSARSARRRAWRSQSASVASAARIVDVAPAASQAADRLVELRGRGRLGPVRLDEEHRLGVAVESQAGRRRRPRRSRLVEQLERHRVRPGGDDPRDRVARRRRATGRRRASSSAAAARPAAGASPR